MNDYCMWLVCWKMTANLGYNDVLVACHWAEGTTRCLRRSLALTTLAERTAGLTQTSLSLNTETCLTNYISSQHFGQGIRHASSPSLNSVPPSALALLSTTHSPEHYDTRLKFYQILSQKMEMNANSTLEGTNRPHYHWGSETSSIVPLCSFLRQNACPH